MQLCCYKQSLCPSWLVGVLRSFAKLKHWWQSWFQEATSSLALFLCFQINKNITDMFKLVPEFITHIPPHVSNHCNSAKRRAANRSNEDSKPHEWTSCTLIQKTQSTNAESEQHRGRLVVLACNFSQTAPDSRCHFSVTAAAIGVRMVPRAVAASSSISAFSRLITHSMASRPWSGTSREGNVMRITIRPFKSGHMINLRSHKMTKGINWSLCFK